MSLFRSALCVSALALTACGQVDYSAAPVGRFDGTVFVMWVGEGGESGDGRFLYVPNPRDPLVFTRANGQTIKPQMMYTDGGSIPRLAQAFKGFSPWGYAPAYMVHDWVFEARHCNKDGSATPKEAELADMTFQDSADLMAEAIRTLVNERRVSRDDTAGSLISSAVAGPISRAAWDRADACPTPRVSPEHLAAAKAAIPGTGRSRIAPGDGLDGPDAIIIGDPNAPSAQIVGVYSF